MALKPIFVAAKDVAKVHQVPASDELVALDGKSIPMPSNDSAPSVSGVEPEGFRLLLEIAGGTSKVHEES